MLSDRVDDATPFDGSKSCGIRLNLLFIKRANGQCVRNEVVRTFAAMLGREFLRRQGRYFERTWYRSSLDCECTALMDRLPDAVD